MEYSRDIIFIVAVILASIWWLFMVKNRTIKKYVIIQGSLLVIAVVVYITWKLLDLPILSFLSFIALIGAIFFYVKAILLKRKLEKPDNHSAKH